jgi:aspartate/methionine/tyrosine aminotransferase
VHDFTLGNPNADPPEDFFEALLAVAAERRAELHRYMPNAGFEETRAAVSRFLAREYGPALEGALVVMTTGAAGGMNVTMRAICNPGDEVIILAPFFPRIPLLRRAGSGEPGHCSDRPGFPAGYRRHRARDHVADPRHHH